MKKILSNLQWAALVLLMVGCATSQLRSDCSAGTGDDTSSVFAIPVMGLIVCLLLAFTSAAAGVFTEYIMKRTTLVSDSLQLQNMHMYFFGIVFNLLGYIVWDRQSVRDLVNGYDVVTWLVVMNYSFSGLMSSWVMRFADNMVKIYAVATSMALTTIVSIIFFSFQPSLQILFGIISITISILMYFDILAPPAAAAIATSVAASDKQTQQAPPETGSLSSPSASSSTSTSPLTSISVTGAGVGLNLMKKHLEDDEGRLSSDERGQQHKNV
jgi:UDP-sugar transporter A1/2/3